MVVFAEKTLFDDKLSEKIKNFQRPHPSQQTALMTLEINFIAYIVDFAVHCISCMSHSLECLDSPVKVS
jgi:hypothetical protein